MRIVASFLLVLLFIEVVDVLIVLEEGRLLGRGFQEERLLSSYLHLAAVGTPPLHRSCSHLRDEVLGGVGFAFDFLEALEVAGGNGRSLVELLLAIISIEYAAYELIA